MDQKDGGDPQFGGYDGIQEFNYMIPQASNAQNGNRPLPFMLQILRGYHDNYEHRFSTQSFQMCIFWCVCVCVCACYVCVWAYICTHGDQRLVQNLFSSSLPEPELAISLRLPSQRALWDLPISGEYWGYRHVGLVL